MNPVEFLIYAAAVDLLQTFRFAFFSKRTALAVVEVVKVGSVMIGEEV